MRAANLKSQSQDLSNNLLLELRDMGSEHCYWAYRHEIEEFWRTKYVIILFFPWLAREAICKHRFGWSQYAIVEVELWACDIVLCLVTTLQDILGHILSARMRRYLNDIRPRRYFRIWQNQSLCNLTTHARSPTSQLHLNYNYDTDQNDTIALSALEGQNNLFYHIKIHVNWDHGQSRQA